MNSFSSFDPLPPPALWLIYPSSPFFFAPNKSCFSELPLSLSPLEQDAQTVTTGRSVERERESYEMGFWMTQIPNLSHNILSVQGCSKRWAPGWENMRWSNCVFLPAVCKENATFCIKFHTTLGPAFRASLYLGGGKIVTNPPTTLICDVLPSCLYSS